MSLCLLRSRPKPASHDEVQDAQASSQAVLELLLDSGADANQKFVIGRVNKAELSGTALHTAVLLRYDAEVLECLVKAGADVNAKAECPRDPRWQDVAPLHAILATLGEAADEQAWALAAVELLVRAGADPGQSSGMGTPLIMAAARLQGELGEQMVARLAAKSALAVELASMTAAEWAACNEASGVEVLDVLLNSGVAPDSLMAQRALMRTLDRGSIDKVQFLLASGVQPLASAPLRLPIRGICSLNPLQWAALAASGDIDTELPLSTVLEMQSLMLDELPEESELPSIPARDGQPEMSMVLHAIRSCPVETIGHLIIHKRDINDAYIFDAARGRRLQRNVIMEALQHRSGDPEDTTHLIRVLLQHGADPTVVSEPLPDEPAHGHTVLHLLDDTSLAVLPNLRQLGCSLDARDALGYTPAAAAVARGQIGLLRMLMMAGADINTRTAAGDTPLHLACSQQHLPPALSRDLCRCLVKAGASMRITNKDGCTALDLADAQGHADVVSLLEMKGAVRRAKPGWGQRRAQAQGPLPRETSLGRSIKGPKIAPVTPGSPRIGRSLFGVAEPSLMKAPSCASDGTGRSHRSLEAATLEMAASSLQRSPSSGSASGASRGHRPAGTTVPMGPVFATASRAALRKTSSQHESLYTEMVKDPESAVRYTPSRSHITDPGKPSDALPALPPLRPIHSSGSNETDAAVTSSPMPRLSSDEMPVAPHNSPPRRALPFGHVADRLLQPTVSSLSKESSVKHPYRRLTKDRSLPHSERTTADLETTSGTLPGITEHLSPGSRTFSGSPSSVHSSDRSQQAAGSGPGCWVTHRPTRPWQGGGNSPCSVRSVPCQLRQPVLEGHPGAHQRRSRSQSGSVNGYSLMATVTGDPGHPGPQDSAEAAGGVAPAPVPALEASVSNMSPFPEAGSESLIKSEELSISSLGSEKLHLASSSGQKEPLSSTDIGAAPPPDAAVEDARADPARDDSSPLHNLEDGQEEYVRLMVRQGADINARDSFGDTPITCAAARGQASIVRMLMLEGGDPHLSNYRGRNALHCICFAPETSDKVVLCRSLLKFGLNASDADADGVSALQAARAAKLPQISAVMERFAQLHQQRERSSSSGTKDRAKTSGRSWLPSVSRKAWRGRSAASTAAAPPSGSRTRRSAWTPSRDAVTSSRPRTGGGVPGATRNLA